MAFSLLTKTGLWLMTAGVCALAWIDRGARPLYVFGAATLLANMVLATGYQPRYDVHLVVTVVMLLAYGWQRAGARWRSFAALALVVTVVQSGLASARAPLAAEEIYLQHQQTSRFVADFLKEPVAVNDLGLVSLRSDHRVLDLWGLGSAEARRARAAGKPGWMQDLVRSEGVDVALVYEGDDWFGDDIPPAWVRVARLRVDRERLVTLGGREVAIFATTPQAVPRLESAVRRFAPTLPDGATLLEG
jgi:hypothetical protein